MRRARGRWRRLGWLGKTSQGEHAFLSAVLSSFLRSFVAHCTDAASLWILLRRVGRVLGLGAALFAKLEKRCAEWTERMARFDARQGAKPSASERVADEAQLEEREALARAMVGQALDGLFEGASAVARVPRRADG